MSFLTRTALRAPRVFAPRAFSTSFVAYKTPVEAAKDTLKTVDKAVAGKIVDGIEIGGMSSQVSVKFPPLPVGSSPKQTKSGPLFASFGSQLMNNSD
jgi:hypothetical protein